MSALFTVNGTIFWSKFMWIQVISLVILMHIVCIGMYMCSYFIESEKYVRGVRPWDFQVLMAMVDDLNILLSDTDMLHIKEN